MKDKTILKIITIIALAILAGVILVMEIDGAYIMLIIVIIAGLAGYEVGAQQVQVKT